jgi:hypothetical protein
MKWGAFCLPMFLESSIVFEAEKLVRPVNQLNHRDESIVCIHQGVSMALSDIIASIDREIAQLQQARALLSGTVAPVAKKKAGRPRKVDVKAAPAVVKTAAKKKRNLSPEGRKRIAEAVKRRWAAQKKAAAASAK